MATFTIAAKSTTRWALGVTHTARKDIEVLDQNVRAYNGFRQALENPTHLEEVRAHVGDEKLAQYVERLKELGGVAKHCTAEWLPLHRSLSPCGHSSRRR